MTLRQDPFNEEDEVLSSDEHGGRSRPNSFEMDGQVFWPRSPEYTYVRDDLGFDFRMIYYRTADGHEGPLPLAVHNQSTFR